MKTRADRTVKIQNRFAIKFKQKLTLLKLPNNRSRCIVLLQKNGIFPMTLNICMLRTKNHVDIDKLRRRLLVYLHRGYVLYKGIHYFTRIFNRTRQLPFDPYNYSYEDGHIFSIPIYVCEKLIAWLWCPETIWPYCKNVLNLKPCSSKVQNLLDQKYKALLCNVTLHCKHLLGT